MSQVAIVARVTVKAGKTDEYVAALAPLLEQAEKEPGTLLYAVHRSKDDPQVFWTTEVYADDAGTGVRPPRGHDVDAAERDAADGDERQTHPEEDLHPPFTDLAEDSHGGAA